MALVIKKREKELIYIPEELAKEKNPFKVKYRALTQGEIANLEDGKTKMYQDSSISFNLGTYNYKMLKLCILGWDNVEGEDGKPIEMEKGADGLITDEHLGAIPIRDKAMLLDLIRKVSKADDI